MARVLEFHRVPRLESHQEAEAWCRARVLEPALEQQRSPEGTVRGCGVREVSRAAADDGTKGAT